MLRLLVPQIVTAFRIVLGAAATIAALSGRAHVAATLITFGAITDGLDGRLATALGVRSAFGAVFDYFADYACYIVAASVLSLSLLERPGNIAGIAAVAIPLMTGAVRYSRNLGLLLGKGPEATALPGMGTVIYAFMIVGLVFVRPDSVLGQPALTWVVLAGIVFTCGMMVAPVPYPKLMSAAPLFAPVAAGLVIMPFVLTRALAAAMLALGFVYAVVSPFAVASRRTRSGV